MRPELLRADNWTPRTRTPWGGFKIVRHYKSSLGLEHAQEVVGESWEVSVEPSFPSVLARTSMPLAKAIADDPVGWLGAAVVSRHGPQLPLLVKLLDAADDLSVQVHPEANDPELAADESGKPEAWIILEAEPGAGIYLGFRDGVDRQTVEACLRSGGQLDTLMNFVPVASGDVFVIDAGTVHAIGAGVTLVEPQHVVPGRRGVTYRYWDWNRRYNAHGGPDPNGSARPLHVERSLAVTRWDGPRGAAFVEQCRSKPRPLESEGSMERVWLLAGATFTSERWQGSGELTTDTDGRFTAVTCVAGQAQLSAGGASVEIRCGQSAVIPA
ncbi:MAG: type I phosphomannose isomerase catalytic subunit, partial [Myxococcota bacterium]